MMPPRRREAHSASRAAFVAALVVFVAGAGAYDTWSPGGAHGSSREASAPSSGASTEEAWGVGERTSPERPLVPPTGLGPRGAHHFCMAPPAPQRREPPPVPEFAPRLREHRLRPSEAGRGLELPDTARVLFILAEFADVPFDTAGIDTTGRNDDDESTLLVDYFSRQLEYIREYYTDVSWGRMSFEPTVLDRVVKLPFRMGYYGEDDLFGERGTKMIWDAVAGADPFVDFAEYTGTVVIHSDAGQESDINNNSKDQIWSAFFPQALLAEVLSDSLGREVPGIPTNDVTAEGDTIHIEGCAIVPERESQDGFNFGIMGVYTHELGHIIAGWPDLYDTTPDDPSQGLGAFCLMAAGTWNANGFVPGEPSAWCRMYAGWVDPVLIDDAPPGGRVVSLDHIERDALAASDTVLVRVPISGDEYFLIANRQPDPDDDECFDWPGKDCWEDRDAGIRRQFSFWTDSYQGAEFDYFTPNLIPNSPQAIYREAEGLYVWHIDESVINFGFPFNIVNSDPHHMGIDLEEADGVQDMEYDIYTLLSFGSPDDAFRGGHAAAFTPRTEPSTHSSFGAPSGVSITEISGPGSTMSFRLEFETGDGEESAPVVREGWPVDVPDLAPGSQPLVTDLLGGAAEEAVLVSADGTVHILNTDGDLAPGPLTIDGAPAGSPLAGDTDGDGTTDLVVVAASGGVHRFAGSGTLRRDLVAKTDSIGTIEGTLANLDADAMLELVIGSRDAGPDSTDGRLWIVDFDAATPAVRHGLSHGALRGAPVVVPVEDAVCIVHPLETGGLLVMEYADGVLTEGKPTLTDVQFDLPSAADVDRDGTLEVLAIGSDRAIYVMEIGLDLTLEAADGWPVQIFATPGGGVSAADITADGIPEVLAIGTGGCVHAYNYTGTPLRGWPKTLDVPIEVFFNYGFDVPDFEHPFYPEAPPHPAPLVADVDGNGRLDLLATFADGLVVALEPGPGHPSPLPGWPVQTPPGMIPVVGDFDGDGKTDIFAAGAAIGSGGELWSRATLWSLGASYRARDDAWRMHRGTPARTAVTRSTGEVQVQGGDLLRDVFCQPNPAYASGTSFHYVLDEEAERVNVTLYDVSGQVVRELDGHTFGGIDNLVRWNGRNTDDEVVSPGLYVYRVTATTGSRTDTFVGKLAFVR